MWFTLSEWGKQYIWWRISWLFPNGSRWPRRTKGFDHSYQISLGSFPGSIGLQHTYLCLNKGRLTFSADVEEYCLFDSVLEPDVGSMPDQQLDEFFWVIVAISEHCIEEGWLVGLRMEFVYYIWWIVFKGLFDCFDVAGWRWLYAAVIEAMKALKVSSETPSPYKAIGGNIMILSCKQQTFLNPYSYPILTKFSSIMLLSILSFVEYINYQECARQRNDSRSSS